MSRFSRFVPPVMLALLLTACAIEPMPYYSEGVMVAPPPPRVEYPGYAPAVGYMWIGGYWAWTGYRHEWVPGRWAPPRPGYRWVEPRWIHDGRYWHQQGGRWEGGHEHGSAVPSPTPAYPGWQGDRRDPGHDEHRDWRPDPRAGGRSEGRPGQAPEFRGGRGDARPDIRPDPVTEPRAVPPGQPMQPGGGRVISPPDRPPVVRESRPAPVMPPPQMAPAPARDASANDRGRVRGEGSHGRGRPEN